MSDRVYFKEEIAAMVVPLLQKYRAEQAILFGSYARQEATADSDIDLMIIGGESFDPTDVFCIADELYRFAGKRVDVYEQNEIDAGSPFDQAIRAEGVRLA